MMTLNDSLLDLVRKGLVDPKDAYRLSVNRTEFATMLTKEGFPVASPER
jgi:twitching motility protein PilT